MFLKWGDHGNLKALKEKITLKNSIELATQDLKRTISALFVKAQWNNWLTSFMRLRLQ